MRLNWEDDGLDAVTQETQRRLAWAIYLIDRQFSGGIEDLALRAATRMDIMDFSGGHVPGSLPPSAMSDGGMAPWDPFDMQMNDYYDPELGQLLMSITR
ncbi:hypothetical protein ACHAP9_005713 [Verticillium nonalfalfae]